MSSSDQVGRINISNSDQVGRISNIYLIIQSFKGTVVNRLLSSLNEWSLTIMLTIPLTTIKKEFGKTK